MRYTIGIQQWDQDKQNERQKKGMINGYALDTRLRDQLITTKKITTEQVAEGEQLAKQWVKQHPDAYTETIEPLELSLELQAEHFAKEDADKKIKRK